MKLIVLALLLAYAAADMYLHNPPGSNDRNRERNDNRNNGNRLFDSQNNGKGGYAWRGKAALQGAHDPMTYYVGSVLRLEWTTQHGCNNPNVACQVIIQYACDDTVNGAAMVEAETSNAPDALVRPNPLQMAGMRDGLPSGPIVDSDNGGTTITSGYTRATFVVNGNSAGTNTIPEDRGGTDEGRERFYIRGLDGGIEYGMHENFWHYQRCKTTQRNKGLYNADQKVNRNDARGTRQNPNGARRGLECPEERDYYPYWNAALEPWTDVAVLVDNLDFCPYFQSHSINNNHHPFCWGANLPNGNSRIPINEVDCVGASGTWIAQGTVNYPWGTMATSRGLAAPACALAMMGRDNHLGNAVQTNSPYTPGAVGAQPETAHYLWEIPGDMAGKACIIRIRYNMSTYDYASMNHALNQEYVNDAFNCPRVVTSTASDANAANSVDTDPDADNQAAIIAAGCTDLLTSQTRPLTNRPYVPPFEKYFGEPKRFMSIALNTNQAGRTFQDRTHLFKVLNPPDTLLGSGYKIMNLNVRGRRGNIVQAYPAVEYDFVPSILELNVNDYVHIQFHGSDFNAAKNANNGEGWRFSDRSNICEMENSAFNFPAYRGNAVLFQESTAEFWCYGGQDYTTPGVCEAYKNGDNGEQNDIQNCAKLNQMANLYPAAPQAGLMRITQSGTYKYVATRNNNFSNRSHKGQMRVGGTETNVAVIVGATFAAVFLVGLGAAGVLYYGYRRPNTVAGRFYQATAVKCPCCIKLCGRMPGGQAGSTAGHGAKRVPVHSPKTTAPPDMEYTRH